MYLIQAIKNRDWRGWVLPTALLIVWYAVTALDLVNTKLIVPPASVVEAASKFIARGNFLESLNASLFRDLSGFAFGGIAGVLFGVAMGLSQWAERIAAPSFNTLKQISLFAWLPLISTWLGTGDPAKILFVSLSVFYPVALNTFEGVRGVPKAQLEVARVYAFTRWQQVVRVILPAASPQILTGLHLGLIYAWMATIGAEFLLVSSGVGLGDTVIRGRAAFNVGLILFGMLAIALIGAFFNHLARRIETKLLIWRGERI